MENLLLNTVSGSWSKVMKESKALALKEFTFLWEETDNRQTVCLGVRGTVKKGKKVRRIGSTYEIYLMNT